MGLKIERAEDRQLPRWVYAMINSKADPNDAELFNDSPKLRGENQVKAENFHRQRQDKLKALSEQTNMVRTCRMDGMEWARRPRTTFTESELNKIIPTRQASYVAAKTGIISVIAICVLIGTLLTAALIAAACAEIKLHGSFGQAVSMLASDPGAYAKRVSDGLKSDD